jgi:hypothetical protein
MTGGASPGRALRSVRSAVVGISTILILSIVAADLVGAAPVGGAVVLWTRQFGSPSVDESFAVAATPEAIYVAGYAVGALGGSPQGGEDVIVRKYQMSGEVIWTDRFGTSSV